MTEQDGVPPGKAWKRSGILMPLAYSAVWFVVLIAINVVAALLLIADVAADTGFGDPLVRQLMTFATDPVMPAWILVGIMIVQFPAMVAIGVVVGRVAATALTRRGVPGADPSRSVIYALAPTTAAMLGLATVIGFTVGWLPGWVAGALREAYPWLDLGGLGMITAALTESWWPWRILLGLLIGIGAPVAEELVFRGFMWNALERALPSWAVWILTSFIFAGYHMDPIQSSALVFTALMLGWVRWMSGSIYPCIVIHIVNNTMAVIITNAGIVEEATPFSVSLGAAAVSVVAAIGVFTTRDRDRAGI